MSLRTAAQQALEALEQFAGTKLVRTSGVINDLRTALAEPEQNDTALLRQALEALEWHIERGAWGQDLEGLTAALRERLGEKT